MSKASGPALEADVKLQSNYTTALGDAVHEENVQTYNSLMLFVVDTKVMFKGIWVPFEILYC